MPDIKKITTVNGTTYDLVDAGARELISELQQYTNYLGVTSTALTDGASTNPITIDNKQVTVKKGDIANYGSKEFIFNGTVWQEFGDLSGLGSLAYKNSADGSYTPQGTVSQPSFTGTAGSVSVSGSISSGSVTIATGSGTANYTPAGSVSFSGSELTSTGKFTPSGSVSNVELNTDTVPNVTGVGSLPSLTTSVENETLQFTWSAGSLPTLGTAKTVATSIKTQPAFTGAEGNLSVKGTPAGSATFSGTGVELTGSIADGSISATGTFTPEGTVSQPSFSGTTATIEVD